MADFYGTFVNISASCYKGQLSGRVMMVMVNAASLGGSETEVDWPPSKDQWPSGALVLLLPK